MTAFAGPRAFARACRPEWIEVPIDIYQWADRSRVETLFRSGCWQIERIVLEPFAVVPRHFHGRCSSCDLIESGAGVGEVAGRIFKSQHSASAAANFLRVPFGAWHSGEVGAEGLRYLSFQQWAGEPSRITEDWHGEAR